MSVTTAHGSFLLTPAFALIMSITLSLLSLFSICQRNLDYAGSGKIFEPSLWLHFHARDRIPSSTLR
jgi:hypothetical protein